MLYIDIWYNLFCVVFWFFLEYDGVSGEVFGSGVKELFEFIVLMIKNVEESKCELNLC